MDKSLEVTILKIEPTDLTSSDRMEISSGKYLLQDVKQESDCLIQPEFDVKTENQEDENEFPVIASTSYDMYPSYDIKYETEEPLIKIELEDPVDEIMKDPLDVGSDIKAEEYFPIDLDGELKIKSEPTEEEKDENFVQIEKEPQVTKSNLQDQLLIKNHSDQKDKKYVCNECNKMFTKKCNLDQHFRIHTGVKPFLCAICEKSFSRKHHLEAHMLVHSGKKPYTCHTCSKVFSRKSTLNEHKLIHSEEKPFSCDECNKSFKRKVTLVLHNRVHTGENLFACNMCDKAFVSKRDLTKHKRIHTGEKPFSCNVCTKSFADISNLKRHKKIHKK